MGAVHNLPDSPGGGSERARRTNRLAEQQIRTILVIRFITGLVGSTPLANTGGSVHDVFARDESGYAMAIYTLSSVIGPPFGNALCGFISQEKGWRWLYWVNLIVAGGMLPILVWPGRLLR